MGNSIGSVGQPLLIVFSIFSLAGCNKPSAPPSFEFEPLESPLSAAYAKCGDISGTYRLTPDSRESRLFSPYQTPPHQMDMVQLRHTKNDFFSYRLKMHKARFVEQVSALRLSNPGGYATWRALITRWQKERREKQDTSVTEAEILQIGPLPELRGIISPSLCEAFWGTVDYRYGAPVGLDEAVEDASALETITLLSRSKQGALLFRYDNYRTGTGLFGGNVRTRIINSAYTKLEPMQHALFDWEVNDETAPAAEVPPGSFDDQDMNAEAVLASVQHTDQASSSSAVTERLANLPAVLVDVQQYAMGELPNGASITHFVLDKSSQNSALWISMKGEANSNKEVSDLLRAMDQHEQVDNVELLNLQRSAKDEVEFEIRLKLKDQTK